MLYTTDLKPGAFFKKYILRVCGEANVNAVEKFLQIDYLSEMLSEFVDPEKHFGDRGELVRLIDAFKLETETHQESLQNYKKAADRILFYHSFFPEFFHKRLASVRFYARAARMFYRVVGYYGMPVCGRIGEEYSLWNFVLKTARLRYMF